MLGNKVLEAIKKAVVQLRKETEDKADALLYIDDVADEIMEDYAIDSEQRDEVCETVRKEIEDH